jgi:5'-deoxy-5'-methylthioadenosine phosphorylase
MLGIIGGSGLASFAELELIEQKSVDTAFGKPSADLLLAKLQNKEVAFIARHGNPHAIAPDKVNYRANIQALKDAGVTEIIAVNAVGGISDEQEAMQLSVPDQLIDYTSGRENSFFDGLAAALQHIDFTYPFDEPLRQKLLAVAKSVDVSLLDKACIGVTQGPRLETAAEIKRLAQDGCDIVGMTSMPEAALARELGIAYAAISVVVNKAAGCSDGLITWPEIEQNMQHGIGAVKVLLKSYCEIYH